MKSHNTECVSQVFLKDSDKIIMSEALNIDSNSGEVLSENENVDESTDLSLIADDEPPGNSLDDGGGREQSDEKLGRIQQHYEANNLLYCLFRLVTPEEISELTTIFTSREKVPLTDILLDRFNKKIEEDTVEDNIELKNLKNTKSIDSDIELSKIEKIPDESEIPTEKKGVVFILDIKNKLKKSQTSLKSKEVMSLYKSTSSIDIENKLDRSDLSKSTNSGILINKKQY